MWGARGGSRGAGEDGGGGVAQSGVVGTGRWEVHLGWGGRGSVRGRVVGDGGGMVGLVRGGVAGLGRRSNAREEVYNMRLSIPRVQIDFLAMQEADCGALDPKSIAGLWTKHIEIRHHFIRDSNEKKLIQMIKVYTDQNVEIAFTKALMFEIASEQSNDPPLSRVATLKSGEDILKFKELMDFCTKLSDRVLDLEITKTAQAKEIASLKKIVNKLERKRKSKTSGMNLFKIGTSRRRSLGKEDASKQGRNLKQGKQSSIFEESDFDDEGFDADIDEVFKYVEGDTEQVISAAADEVPTGTEVNTASAPVTNVGISVSTAEPITTAMRSEKSKVRGVFMQEPSETATRPTVPPQQHDPKDKRKAQMQAKLKEEERLAREREEDANIAEWDNAQAIMDAYYKLAARIQAHEHEELTIEEKSRLFVELMDKRKKHFARLRAEEQRRKPLTKAQKRNQMCTYLKNIAGFTHNQLKNKSFDEVQKAFDNTISWIDSFVHVDSEVVKGSKDRVEGSETRAEGNDRDDVNIDVTPLSVKIPIVDYKIYQEGKKSFFQIIRADSKTQMYRTFSKMIKNFDREDLEVLWKIVKARFKKTELVNYIDTFLHLNLETMFEHHVEDSIWKNQQGLVKVLNWKLFYSCGVHCVTVQTIPYYILVEKVIITKHNTTSDV
ncbi:hypothetical protein Tco_1314565 [Tanacetum coccineum]